jgi:hypothetical protein
MLRKFYNKILAVYVQDYTPCLTKENQQSRVKKYKSSVSLWSLWKPLIWNEKNICICNVNAGILLGLFDPEDGGNMFLLNAGLKKF